MNTKYQISKKEYLSAENKLNTLLALVTKKGGFDKLTKKEKADLAEYTQKVNSYESAHYEIPYPETVAGLIELKMYEQKLKQKDVAKLLHTTDTRLSEIMNNKRKPTLNILKAIHEIFGIDGNLLLRIA